MRLLSRAEEAVLLAVLKLGRDAYGVSIRGQIQKDTGIEWSFASIYTPLDKLTHKKYVKKIKGEPSPERGGKSRYYYRVTLDGRRALVRIREFQQSIWSRVPDISLESGGPPK